MRSSTVVHVAEKQHSSFGENALGILIKDIVEHDQFAINGILLVSDEWYFNQAEVLKFLLGLECQSENREVLRAIKRSKPHMTNNELKSFIVGLSVLARKHKSFLSQFL